MTPGKFAQLAANRFDACGAVMITKSEEYSRNNDRLHNFKRAAAIDGTTPARSLWGMWKKHIVSIADMIDDIDAGKVPSEAMVAEKLGDNINYSILLEGLIVEAREKSTPLSERLSEIGLSRLETERFASGVPHKVAPDPLAALRAEEWEEIEDADVEPLGGK